MQAHVHFIFHHKRMFLLFALIFILVFLYIDVWLLEKLQQSYQRPKSFQTEFHSCVAGHQYPGFYGGEGHSLLTSSNLPFLVDELMRINHSVRNELIELDQRRRDLLGSVSAIQSQVERVRSVLLDYSRQFMRLRATLIAYEQQLSDREYSASAPFVIEWPGSQNGLSLSEDYQSIQPGYGKCSVDSHINWKRCPLPGFLKFCLGLNSVSAAAEHVKSLVPTLSSSPHYVPDCSPQNAACLKIVMLPQDAAKCLNESVNVNKTFPTCFAVITDLSSLHELYIQLKKSKSKRSILIASPHIPQDWSESNCIFLLPTILPFSKPFPPIPILPGRRAVLLSFSCGRIISSALNPADLATLKDLQAINDAPSNSESLFKLKLHQTEYDLSVCWPPEFRQTYSLQTDFDFGWLPCQDSVSVLGNSTFGLLLGDSQSLGWQTQLVLCLGTGAIPVILGDARFPLDEAVQLNEWSRAVIRLPKPRLRELPVILQSIPENHLVELRRQGGLIFDRHLQDWSAQIRSLLLAVSRRLGYPQPPAQYWPATPAYGGRIFKPPRVYPVPRESTYQADLDDFIGPIGPELNSPNFSTNFTGPGGSAQFATVSMYNGPEIVAPHWLYPSTPWDVFLPSDAPHSHYNHTRTGLRPINHTINTAGLEFNTNLGGMRPYEQFTIVLLTYDRFEIACRTLERFLNLPYLHSVVVVWNHPIGPKPDLSWPEIHVPIMVIHAQNNSLNNRFLPYNIIHTDAVLSVDDDIQLRHDEIVFGFRIWREHRDQLVGFPARAHFWNSSSKEWYYNSDYTCEFSMVITGAAFYHRYYSFIYTWEMPFTIRKMVDDKMNCEDLAMNFLIAHITRKAPIKATIHWSFDCPYCATTLHDKPNHYKDRSECINWLTRVYGYNPLVYSQYRADSLLFKTRIPPTKQKCYKFI
ncbi:unnamed protein product [Calicophoron daubneyi]|uniref:Glycosyl transferase 64 domain-containing protein n=1 Tax=Calicophoron daubneyi TaxID=300641 RepID=A0AAV2TZV3_CALDB